MSENNAGDEWNQIIPEVNGTAEFLEIVNDFGNPLEIVREAISNAIDWNASFIKISFDVEQIDGATRSVIRFVDDGDGMTQEVITKDFWGLGFSQSRERKKTANTITGEKGHGTKIFLRSENVSVRTRSNEGCFEATCEFPLKALTQHKLHSPRWSRINCSQEKNGTEITVIGYNDNERSKFVQEIVADYIKWYTKAGSVELMFGIDGNRDFKILLKCLDISEFEEITFGHPFPDENDDIKKLFDQKEHEAADFYVKRFVYANKRLKQHPEVTFNAIISVEGDEIKREYNPMIRDRSRSDTGRYKVSDRYGMWICKDFIPIVRINEWISGFGTGSNSLTLVHGFINCQSLKLTANRGTVANTDPQILEELRQSVQQIFNEVDEVLHREGIYTLKTWQQEARTLSQETSEFSSRVKSIRTRNIASHGGRTFLEPNNESEVFGLFTSVYSIAPERFLFEPLDYNTNRGIDLIVRNKSDNQVRESEFSYIELKYQLKTKFNHAFRHLRWIVCWDFDKNVGKGTEFIGVEETDRRAIDVQEDDDGHPLYFLGNKRGVDRIQIIRLKEYLKNKLGLEFKPQTK